MGKINLIDQLRNRGTGGAASAPKSSMFGFLKNKSTSDKMSDLQFDEGASGSDLDAYEKRKVVMLLVGIALVLGGRQLVPMYTAEVENSVRNDIAELDAKISVEQAQAEQLKMVQEEMNQYESRVGDLNAKLKKIRQLNEERNLLVRMTDYIIKEMPSRLWFETIELDTRSMVKITGYSTNYQLVSDFMKKLEGAVYFPKWRLLQTESKSLPGTIQDSESPKTDEVSIPLDSKQFVLEAETVSL